jgi:L-lactate utilization protein LutB
MNYQMITSGIAALLIIIPFAMLTYMLLRNKGEAILCMECQQCRAVCPVLQNTEEYAGPKDIMVAAKSGKYSQALEKNIQLCSACAACMERCPRKLEVDALIREISHDEMGEIMSRGAIDYLPKVPNPKMQRTYEAVVRRSEGKELHVPWDWITKTFRLRKSYNPFDDNARKPLLKTQAVKGAEGLRKIGDSIFSKKEDEKIRDEK